MNENKNIQNENMNTQNENQNEKATVKKRGLSKWLKFLIASVSVASIAVGVYTYLNNTDLSDTPFGNFISDAPDIDPNAGKYVAPEEDENVSKGISIPGWDTINIPEHATDVSVDFYNPEENSEMYYLTFELRLPNESEDGYEVLYKSGLVDPGLHIQNITLSHELEAGAYDAIVHVQPYCMDEQKTATNNADMQTQLIVG
ncbi:MAG: hypothetical protein K2J32_10145 [Ruminococcus sp.]|nr:hypothetical protein [Ruminococcus sp.]